MELTSTERAKIEIALFMDYKHEGETLLTLLNGEPNIDVDSLEYDTSWDWLMPVVKKIDGIANEEMSIDEFDNYRTQWAMIDKPSKYPIEKVYNQIVEFIEWYEENK